MIGIYQIFLNQPDPYLLKLSRSVLTNEDLSTYPSDFEGDIQKLKSVPGGVDVVFCPKNLYDYGNSQIEMDHRKGVATVVTKLFNLVEPDVAVFGKKDYQQWRIIHRMGFGGYITSSVADDAANGVLDRERMLVEGVAAVPSFTVEERVITALVRDLDFGIKVIGSEIVREHDGLAMSSRNVKLSPENRQKRADRIMPFRPIDEAGGRVDYAEIVEQESLEAVEAIKRGGCILCMVWKGQAR
ncbi:hypothetical protein HAX54_043866 [Datura stramonium]|uniref:Pantoate--beta-alanine ligase n=1 Tax=Datura stramonium TaxID=4076 RepID=A0ABS8W660_DATST|nr:hypothetical protein [Datura stramonium]